MNPFVRIFLLVSIFFTNTLWAGSPFQIIGRTSDLDPSVPAENAILQALTAAADNMQTDINSGFLADSERQTFADRISRANASNMSSLVGDRGSNPNEFSVGLGLQGAFYFEGESKSVDARNTLPALGVGAQTTLLIGTTGAAMGIPAFAFVDPKRLMIFFNAMKFSTAVSKVKLSMFNLGANAFYKLVTPTPGSNFAKWGGLTLGTGLNYSTNTISYSANINSTSPVEVSGETASITADLGYTIGMESLNFFVPLELSTNVSFFYLFTVTFGVAADFNFGSSKMTGTATGPITANYTGTTNVTNLMSGTASLNLDDGITGNPPSVMARVFGGVQLNIGICRFVTEAIWLGNGALAGSAQIRFAM